ncbi:hypothetical protein MTR_3g448950 [Medicago truncatula]|uniref:Uncharacterized protein n=2 Tax=Medicago truncatula TaxID=3880 RepID=A0A072UWZ6_MEDTR|nr:hypothetical protein MTR_3g448950 [Medicago truncatula]
MCLPLEEQNLCSRNLSDHEQSKAAMPLLSPHEQNFSDDWLSGIKQHITATQVTRMSCDLTKPFCDNDHVYNYPFALMSILNTRHRPCHPCLVQYWARRHFSCYVGGANSI